jgi:hypothetical protein
MPLRQPAPTASHPVRAEIMNGRPQQRIRAGRVFVMEREDVEFVLAGQRFDQPQERRNDLLAA